MVRRPLCSAASELATSPVATKTRSFSRLERAHRCFAGAVLGDDRAHLQCVRYHEPLELERVTQHSRQHRGRQRRGRLAGECRKGNVRAHHHLRAGVDPRTKRHELDRVEPSVVDANRGETDVRVRIRVAVAREVFQRGEHPVVLQPAHIAAHEARDGLGVLPERAGVDDRIERVIVDVRVRGEIHVDADGAPLDCGDPADRVGVALVARRAGGHDVGKRRGTHDAHCGAPLEIGRNEQRQPGTALQRIELRRDVVG